MCCPEPHQRKGKGGQVKGKKGAKVKMFLSPDEFEELIKSLEEGRIYPPAVELGVIKAQNLEVGERGGLSVLEC
jgi:hypothetical protein